MSKLVIYTTEDGTAWLSQSERLVWLNQTAIGQMTLLLSDARVQKIGGKL